MNKRQVKKKRKKAVTKYIIKTLLTRKETERGNIIYQIPASKVRDEEFKKMVRRANDRLRALEKAGLFEESREYRLVSHYAYSDPSGKGSIYNVNPEKDTIRFSSKLPEKGLQYEREREYMINTLRNFLNAETSTVSGTKAVINRAYESFMAEHGKRSDMTQDEYMKMWRIYHDMGLRDKLDNQGYNAFMTLMTQTDLYSLNEDEIKTALEYIEKSDKVTTSGLISDVITNMEMEENITLAW